jgi:hypothetical protein
MCKCILTREEYHNDSRHTLKHYNQWFLVLLVGPNYVQLWCTIQHPCDQRGFWIIRQYLYWTQSLQAIFCYCPHRCMTLHQLLSYNHKKKLRFSTITGPVMGFPSACTAANHLHNTLFNCGNLGSFKVCWLVGPFTLLLKATNDHNWSLHFSVSQTVMIWCIKS